jgi:hypothetical protein
VPYLAVSGTERCDSWANFGLKKRGTTYLQDTLKDMCRVTVHELSSDLAVLLLANGALITLHTFVTSPKCTMLSAKARTGVSGFAEAA